MSTEVDGVTPASVLDSLSAWKRVEAMTNEALSEAFLEKVWGQLTPESEQDRLATELLHRFERMAGVEREESGDIMRPTEAMDFPESLEYLQGAVAVAAECGEETVRVRVDRVRDLLEAVGDAR